MGLPKSLEQNLDKFKKINAQLENLDEKVDPEDQAIILLNNLPSSFSKLKTTIKYAVKNDL